MAKGHALTGAIAGVGVYALDASAPVYVGVPAGLLTLACVYLPDIDSPRATITRTLGPLGWLLHRLTIWVGKTLFLATRTDHDEKSPGTGHRLISHTLVAAVGTGVLVASLVLAGDMLWTGPVSGTPGVPAGLLGLLGTALGYWWLWGLAAGTGHAVGMLGDALTVAGVPLLWPLRIHGKRWYNIRIPLVAFHADSSAEHGFYWVLMFALGCSVIMALGWWTPMWHAATQVVGIVGS